MWILKLTMQLTLSKKAYQCSDRVKSASQMDCTVFIQHMHTYLLPSESTFTSKHPAFTHPLVAKAIMRVHMLTGSITIHTDTHTMTAEKKKKQFGIQGLAKRYLDSRGWRSNHQPAYSWTNTLLPLEPEQWHVSMALIHFPGKIWKI